MITAKILARINDQVIGAGYRLLGQDIDVPIAARCDSLVVESDLHFPTDINLLYDAIRVLIRGCVGWSEQYPLPGWRQHEYNLRKLKKQYRKVQKMKHSTCQDAAKSDSARLNNTNKPPDPPERRKTRACPLEVCRKFIINENYSYS